MTAFGPQTCMTTLVTTPQTELDPTLAIYVGHESYGLQNTSDGQILPGQPRVRLEAPELFRYLRKQHLVPELDKLVYYISMV